MLLTRKDIAIFQLDPRAIEMVPESVGRGMLVLPLQFKDGTLQLLLPAEAGLGDDDSIEPLSWVLECPIAYQFAVTDDLRPFVDFYYTAVYAGISNCGSKMKFRCPKLWADLDPTDDMRVRFCGVCNRSVTFCADSNELAQLSARNECVAFFDRKEQVDFLGLPNSN